MKIALNNIVRTFFVLTLVLSFSAFIAQAEVVKIKTNAHCDACKKAIEGGLKKVDGIQKVNVTLKDKVAAVEFDAKKINTNKIREEIAKIGYEADGIKPAKNSECKDNNDPKCKGKCKAGEGCNDKKTDASKVNTPKIEKAPTTKTVAPKTETNKTK
ncbi:MAG TPA: heavy-metal-associated domain-containing protein [Candidatus Kapabacteria bacterium]|nr:heavy-metal-associated domain-containing protein [Candidatus Kapabacteria bacterium]HPO62072.1 heavy-metal-associated domain-containing protein [Candidatus Kapabacteria bacterium]